MHASAHTHILHIMYYLLHITYYLLRIKRYLKINMQNHSQQL